jgi:hypothetical protein
MAEHHGQRALAAQIASLGGADPAAVQQRAELVPAWLQERIDLSYAARIAVGEDVSWAENARDQIAAFTDLVSRRPHFRGPWIGTPDPALAPPRAGSVTTSTPKSGSPTLTAPAGRAG